MDQVGGPIAMHERLDLFHHFVSLRLRSARRFSSRFSIHSYNTGSRNSVNKVEVINPPTTTVASGLCVSAPTPLDRSIGTRPRIARPEERRVGKEGVSTWRSRWSPLH